LQANEANLNEDFERSIRKASADFSEEAFLKTGNTYFRTGMHYHRLRKLDYCVRDGNRYDLSDMVTGKTLAAYSPARAY
jgi:hypothetical protein